MTDPKGLYNRYHITKKDGSETEEDAVYFVLKPNSKDNIHAQASREALLIYAKRVQALRPELAADIREKLEELEEPVKPKRRTARRMPDE